MLRLIVFKGVLKKEDGAAEQVRESERVVRGEHKRERERRRRQWGGEGRGGGGGRADLIS
jgi:hypothetical protein